MSILRVTSIKDQQGLSGFNFASGAITSHGTLKITNININGTITGSSKYIIPSLTGHSGKLLTTDGANLSWATVSSNSGFRSMQVYTSNGTWTKPSGIRSIRVQVVGAGGGGSGHCESGGAGGMAEMVIDVTNVSSVGVSVGNPGGGTNYAGCGGNGNGSSFGGYFSAAVVLVLIVLNNTLVDWVVMGLVVV